MEFVRYNPVKNIFEYDDKSKGVLLPQIVWHITSKCNLSCPYCFAKKDIDNDKLDIEESIKLFKVLGIQKVDISGGEPLLCNKLDQICSKLFDQAIFQTITTTGYGDVHNYEWLLKNTNIFSRIIFSLDGTEGLHNKLRGNRKLFSEEIKKIQQIKQINYSKLRINTVITPLFIGEEIDKMINLMNNLLPYEWCLIQMHPANNNIKICEKESNNNFEKVSRYIIDRYTGNIILRTLNGYSGYWVVNANGYISKHTTNNKDTNIYNFNRLELENIKKSIILSENEYPKNRMEDFLWKSLY